MSPPRRLNSGRTTTDVGKAGPPVVPTPARRAPKQPMAMVSSAPEPMETPPAAEGRLADRPLPRLVQQLYRKRVTGRLVIQDEAGDESLVYLREGSAVHVDRPNDLDRLDRVLVETGLVSQRVVDRAAELSLGQGKRLGQVLLEMNALSPDVLADAIRAQLRRKLIRLFFVRKGRYEVFLHEHDYGRDDEMARIRLDPRSLLYPGIRTAYDDVRLMDELRPLTGFRFRLVALPAGFLDAMALGTGDATVMALQSRSLRLNDLPTLGGKLGESRAAVLALLYADLLETERLAEPAPAPPLQAAPSRVAQALSPVPSARTPSRPPRITPLPAPGHERAPSPPAPRIRLGSGDGVPRPVPPGHTAPVIAGAELRRRIEALMPKLEDLTLFELLGLTESASPEQVSAAYMQGVRQFHPDRLTGLGLADLVRQAERIMAKFGEASSVLSDAKRRAEYVRKLRGQPSEADSARNIIEAEQAWKQGETALKRGDLPRALERFNEAVKRNPAEHEYRAYLAWARYSESPSSKPLLAADTLRIIREALQQRPHFARGHFWIGEICKHQGQPEAAEAAFRACLEIDKDFLEAERELRLIDMRRKKGRTQEVKTASPPPPGKPGAGLLQRFLKR